MGAKTNGGDSTLEVEFFDAIDRDGVVASFQGREIGFYPRLKLIEDPEPTLPWVMWGHRMGDEARKLLEKAS